MSSPVMTSMCEIRKIIARRPAQMLSTLAGGEGELRGDAQVSGLFDDTRKIQPGDAYLCLPRAVEQASLFVQQAADAGAACVICIAQGDAAQAIEDCGLPLLLLPDMQSLGALLRRWFGTVETQVRLFGVTGTDGKTSVTWMLREAMQRHLGKSWAVGTLGWVKEDGSFADIGNTTPSLLSLHALLADAGEQGVVALCCEVSS
ncbi:MAG: Mur ligase family protein, partial [Mariprofundaceae bacterium]|nr:Mur ligase family protein [Mariprofundaceae bacterium]